MGGGEERGRVMIHLHSTRLFVNAGMEFPLCQANARLLDCDKGHWKTTGNVRKVECRNCLRVYGARKGGES